MGVTALAGTRKGLFVLRSADDGRREWTLEGPHLVGWSVYHAILDLHDSTIYACTNHAVYDAAVHRSTDLGETWQRTEPLGMPEDSDLRLEATWHIRPGHQPGTVWLGGAPGVLFRSTDGAESFEPVAGLVDHPTRERWNPGAGGMCCHSIQLDPSDPERLYVAISAAGAFRSDDGGETWAPRNRAVAADFMPEDRYPEVGQCVHKLLVHPARPERLWQQNHCGVYRSDDRGDTWERLDGNGLPSDFGFPILIHPRDPDSAWVVPQHGAENRVSVNDRLGVWQTADAGATWTESKSGLPAPAYVSVLREASTSDALDPVGLYVGTQSGSVFVSPSAGEDWVEAASQLPPVLSLEVSESPS
jgi:photosystem II stability/assembly factor-like uncharacterized protein